MTEQRSSIQGRPLLSIILFTFLTLSLFSRQVAFAQSDNSLLLDQVGGEIGDIIEWDEGIAYSLGARVVISSTSGASSPRRVQSDILPAPVRGIANLADEQLVVAMPNTGIAILNVFDAEATTAEVYLDDEANYDVAVAGQYIVVANAYEGVKLLNRMDGNLVLSDRAASTGFHVREIIVIGDLVFAIGVLNLMDTKIESFRIDSNGALEQVGEVVAEGHLSGRVSESEGIIYAEISTNPSRVLAIDTKDPLAMQTRVVFQNNSGSLLFVGVDGAHLLAILNYRPSGGEFLEIELESSIVSNRLWVPEDWSVVSARSVNHETFMVDHTFGLRTLDLVSDQGLASSSELLMKIDSCEFSTNSMLIVDGSTRIWDAIARATRMEHSTIGTWRSIPSAVFAYEDEVFAIGESDQIDVYEHDQDSLVHKDSIAFDAEQFGEASAVAADAEYIYLITTVSSRRGATRTLTEISRANTNERRQFRFSTDVNVTPEIRLAEANILLADGYGGLVVFDRSGPELKLIDREKLDSKVTTIEYYSNQIFIASGRVIYGYLLSETGKLIHNSSIGLPDDIVDLQVDSEGLFAAYRYDNYKSGISYVDIKEGGQLALSAYKVAIPGEIKSIGTSPNNRIVACTENSGVLAISTGEETLPYRVWIPSVLTE